MTARFMPHGLQLQEAPRAQSSLFDAPRCHPGPLCEHAGDRQQQERLDGQFDTVCCACGSVVAQAWRPRDAEDDDRVPWSAD